MPRLETFGGDDLRADTIRILSLATRVALMPFGARVFEPVVPAA